MSAQLQNFSGGRTVTPRKLLAQVRRPAGSRLFILLLLMPGGLQCSRAHNHDKVLEMRILLSTAVDVPWLSRVMMRNELRKQLHCC